MGLSNEALAASAAGGDGEAFAELFDRLYSLCFAVARQWLSEEDRADDVVMESFARTYESICTGQFDPSRCSSFRAWQMRVVTNLCIDRIRKPAAESVPPGGSDDGTFSLEDVQAPEATDPDADPFVGLREAWPHLSPRQKAVLQLKYLADLTWDEVAVELGISVNQARYLARTAREVLRPFIDGTD